MRKLIIGCTPDPDDAFAWYAAATGRVAPPRGFELKVQFDCICELNELAARNEIDVAAISSVAYPRLARHYAILRPGASVGRGYGPRLAARTALKLDDLAGKRVGVPGITSTGATLLRLFAPAAQVVPMAFGDVAPALCRGELDAGVLIHEELLRCNDYRLFSVACLGELWTRRTGSPLPVGLNVVRRSLGRELCAEISRVARDSVIYALEHREEATAWALRFSRVHERELAEQFIAMFANSDTVSLPHDCEEGLRQLYGELRGAGLLPAGTVAPLDLVEPALSAADAQHVQHCAGLQEAHT